MSWQRGTVLCFLAICILGCSRDPHGSAGFVLPPGDAARGFSVLVEMQCSTCHRVRGHAELPVPTVQPPVPIVLGDPEDHTWTDGEVVTAIIHPSFRISPRYPAEWVRVGDRSRMGEYGAMLTVQDLVDLVTFLQSLNQSDMPMQREPAWRTSPLGS